MVLIGTSMATRTKPRLLTRISGRHLAEFWMIEPELAFADIFDDMTLAEAAELSGSPRTEYWNSKTDVLLIQHLFLIIDLYLKYIKYILNHFL